MTQLTSRLVSISFYLSALFSLPFAAVSACAQDLDDAAIGGRISDQSGASVITAKVTATLVATGFARVANVDDEGRYRLIDLAPGVYVVRAEAAGFAVEEKLDVALIAGQSIRLDFTLQPAGVVAETVIVSDEGAPAVDTARTVVGGTLTRAEIESLPVFTRAPLDLVFTLGGVTEEPLSVRDAAEDRERNPARTPEESGTFALAGGAAYSNNLTIDGLDNNDDRAARERFQPSLEAIAEVQVITNQFSAEYGRASGGRVNLLTRGGTKDFHGRAFYFFKDEALNANSYFNNLRGLKRLPLQQHNPGFTLGGPFSFRSSKIGPSEGRRQRTFFFVADEYDTTLDSTVIDTLCRFAHKSRMCAHITRKIRA